MNGKWLVTVHTFMGDMRSHYDITLDGTKLGGMAQDAANGATAPVEKGVYNDGDFSFEITIKTAVGEMTNQLSGKFDGEKIIGVSKNPMGEFNFDGVRE